ncbi:MAG: CHASE2 domain-containing protein [Sphingobium sp.]
MRRGRLFVEWLLIGLGASLVVLLSVGSSLVERADRLLYDMVAPFHAAPADDRLLIVAIDDDTLAATGRWPLSRDIHAQALSRMKAARPAAILYDILFIEPSAQDRRLADAMAGQPPVYLPMLFDIPGLDGAPWLIHRPISPIAEAAGGIGTANLSLDRDGRARSIAIATAEDGADGADSANAAPILPHLAELSYRRLVGHSSPAFERTRATGEALHIPFLPPGSFRTISLLPVLRGEVPADFLRGKILLVGATAEGLGDIHPVSTAHAGRLPGVEVQANLLSSLLADRFVTLLPGWLIALLSLLPLLGVAADFLAPLPFQEPAPVHRHDGRAGDRISGRAGPWRLVVPARGGADRHHPRLSALGLAAARCGHAIHGG